MEIFNFVTKLAHCPHRNQPDHKLPNPRAGSVDTSTGAACVVSSSFTSASPSTVLGPLSPSASSDFSSSAGASEKANEISYKFYYPTI